MNETTEILSYRPICQSGCFPKSFFFYGVLERSTPKLPKNEYFSCMWCIYDVNDIHFWRVHFQGLTLQNFVAGFHKNYHFPKCKIFLSFKISLLQGFYYQKYTNNSIFKNHDKRLINTVWDLFKVSNLVVENISILSTVPHNNK